MFTTLVVKVIQMYTGVEGIHVNCWTKERRFESGPRTCLRSPNCVDEVYQPQTLTGRQGGNGSSVWNFEFGLNIPLADLFFIWMKWIYHQEAASNSLAVHNDMACFLVTIFWHLVTVKDCRCGCLCFLKFLLSEACVKQQWVVQDIGLLMCHFQQFAHLKYKNISL